MKKSSFFKLLILYSITLNILSKKDLLNLPEESNQLFEINENNYSNVLNKYQYFFLLIHNPWCQWSQRFYKKLVDINLLLKQEKQENYIGYLDNTTQINISYLHNYIDSNKINNNIKHNKFKSYPTLYFFINGRYADYYNGILSKSEIFSWIKQRIYNLSKDNFYLYNVSSEDVFNNKVKNIKYAMLYYLDETELNEFKYLNNKAQYTKNKDELIIEYIENENSNFRVFSKFSGNLLSIYLANSFDKLINYCSEIVFFYTTEKQLINKYNINNAKIFLFNYGNLLDFIILSNKNALNSNYEQNHIDDITSTTNDKLSHDLINDLCFKNVYKNLFKKFDQYAIYSIFIKKKPSLFLFRNKQDNRTEYEEIKLETISYMYNKELNIVITDIDDKYSYKLSNLLGISNDDLPSIRLIDFKGHDNEMRTFYFSREITSDNILDFVNKWEDNTLSSSSNIFYSSSKINTNSKYNKNNNYSPVLNIGMNMFYEKVIMNNKNVLVYYYANWCSYCKKFLSIFDIISKKLNMTLISLFQIDIGNYYLNSIRIEDVPAIVLYTNKNKNNPIYFEKDISTKNIISFLNTNISGLFKEDL